MKPTIGNEYTVFETNLLSQEDTLTMDILFSLVKKREKKKVYKMGNDKRNRFIDSLRKLHTYLMLKRTVESMMCLSLYALVYKYG